MAADPADLQRAAGGTVHTRTIARPDGRRVWLYGRAPNTHPVIAGEALQQVVGSHVRRHPLRGDWAVYAAARQNRTFKPSAAADPIAPSREGMPLTEIPVCDFELAIFENRFPSFHASPGPAPEDVGCETAGAEGQCDVVVYGPEPTGSMATLSQARRRLLIAAWIDRYAALFDAGAAFVLPFESRGDAVGVTLHHPHGQIYGFPEVPPPQRAARDAFENGYALHTQLADWEGPLSVASAGGMMAYAPPFARFPYEVWISARRPVAGPWEMTGEECDGLASLMGDVCARYDAHFGEATPYMMTLHAAPRGCATFEFTVQFYPLLRAPGRLKYLASVEQATGVFTVDVMPDVAAARLRAAL